jgi:hypothetical protein
MHLALWLGEVWSSWRLGSRIEIYRECSLPRSALSACIAHASLDFIQVTAVYHNNPYLSIVYGRLRIQAFQSVAR